jgi:hypothetical protein
MARVAPAAACILTQATALWPNRSTASDGTIGDASHASRTSDHNPDSRGVVHAADLTHDPAHGCDAHAQADAIRIRAQNHQEPRAKYIISSRRIASPETNWEWTYYDGSNPHDHHAHFSVNSGSIENSTVPWFNRQGGLTVGEAERIIDVIEAKHRLRKRNELKILRKLNQIRAAQTNIKRDELAALKRETDQLDAAIAELDADLPEGP